MRYRTILNLGPEDAAYLGGLIDGEGTISLTHRHAGERRHLVVSISSTEPCILEWVLSTVGSGKITRKRVASSLHAPGLTYSISNRQALSLLVAVEPYLRSYKRQRAKFVLDRYLALTPRNGKYSPAMSHGTRRIRARLSAHQVPSVAHRLAHSVAPSAHVADMWFLTVCRRAP